MSIITGRLGLAAAAAVTLATCISIVRAEDAAPSAAPPAATQATRGIKREILQKFDVPGTNYETVIMRVTLDANFEVQPHTHPGPEGSYVLEGDVTYLIDGADPVVRSANGSIYIPANSIHGAKIGPKGAVLLGTYVVEKGKPITTPAGPDGAKR